MCEDHWVNAHWPQSARASTSTHFAHAPTQVLNAQCQHEQYGDALCVYGVGGGGAHKE